MKAERFVGCACVLPLFGAVASGAASIDASRRSLESLVTTAGGARALHARGEVQMRSDLDSCKGFALNRFFDSTPVFLRFGKLTDLAGSARYLKKSNSLGGLRSGPPSRMSSGARKTLD